MMLPQKSKCCPFNCAAAQRVGSDALNRAVGGKCHGAVNEITDKRKDHRHLVADAVNEQAEHDDAHAERPDARARQFTGGDLVQAKVGHELPAAQDDAADEGVGRGDQGDETAPEQDFVMAIVHDGWSS